jgi:hypothetical protein
LGEDILQALLVIENMDHIPNKIMTPHPQSKDNGNQLKAMRRIVIFMTLELSGRMSNHMTFMHKHSLAQY